MRRFLKFCQKTRLAYTMEEKTRLAYTMEVYRYVSDHENRWENMKIAGENMKIAGEI